MIVVLAENKLAILSPKLVENVPETASRHVWRLAAQAALSSGGYAQLGNDIATCGDRTRPGAVVWCEQCGNSRAVVFTCHSRLCPSCETRAQAQRLAKYLPVLAIASHNRQLGYRFRHVTITTDLDVLDKDIQAAQGDAWRVAKKMLDAVLYRQIEKLDRLTADEKRRKKINWKNHRVGALAGGEFGEIGGKFHMHFFIYSPFLLHEWLVEELEKASDGRWRNVDIRAKNDALDSKEIIAKYATKLSALPMEKLAALQSAIAGTRRVRSYGIWHGVAMPDDDRPCGCSECGGKLRFEAIESALEWRIALENIDAWYAWRKKFRQDDLNSLILKHGNNSCAEGPRWQTPLLL